MKYSRIFLTFLMSIFMNNIILHAESELLSISFGPVKLGEERIPISLSDFKIKINQQVETREPIDAHWMDESVEWLRTTSNLLTPRARLKITISSNSDEYTLTHNNRSIIFQKEPGKLTIELPIVLFSYSPIEIKRNGKKAAAIEIHSKAPSESNTLLIDYSCSKYNLKISGIKHEYLSVGCHERKVGEFGKEKIMLEVSFIATNLRLMDGTLPPYLAIIPNNHPVVVSLIDNNQVKRKVQIQATLPERFHRFKTSVGFGPYFFRTEEKEQKLTSKISPSVMLYGNFYLSPSTSIRAFDAFIMNQSLFNNFGIYAAYQLGSILDGRIEIIPLLGFQGLTFRHHKKDSYSKIIFPQGFEVAYKHAFGLTNHSFVYGMFFSTSNEEQYQNFWVRFGKRVFGEINYITWRENDRTASMWGVSIGIPFFSLF